MGDILLRPLGAGVGAGAEPAVHCNCKARFNLYVPTPEEIAALHSAPEPGQPSPADFNINNNPYILT